MVVVVVEVVVLATVVVVAADGDGCCVGLLAAVNGTILSAYALSMCHMSMFLSLNP